MLSRRQQKGSLDRHPITNRHTACCHSSQTAQRIIRPSSCHQHTDGVLSHRQHRGSSDRHPVTNRQTACCHMDSTEDHQTVILSPTHRRRVVTQTAQKIIRPSSCHQHTDGVLSHRQQRGSSDRHPVTNTQTVCCHTDSREDHQTVILSPTHSRRVVTQTAQRINRPSSCHQHIRRVVTQTAQRIIRPSSCHQHTDGVLSHRQHRGSSDRHPVTNTYGVLSHTAQRIIRPSSCHQHTDGVLPHRQHRGSSDRHPVTNTYGVLSHRRHRGSSDRHPVTNTQTACCHTDSREDHQTVILSPTHRRGVVTQTAQRIIRPSSCHQHTDGVLSHRQHRGSSDRHPVTNTQTACCHTDSTEDHQTVILSPTHRRCVVIQTAQRIIRLSSCHQQTHGVLPQLTDSTEDHQTVILSPTHRR